ncbi:MAG: hypothetical protein ABTQ34_03935 [Bdellovibrionales bacterium]
MKLFNRIAATLALVISAIASSAPADAAIVHLGNVFIGQTGSISNSVEVLGSGYAHGFADGYLPANSMITFTYNTSILPSGSSQALGSHASVSGNTLTNILSVNGVNSGSSFVLSPMFMPTAFVPPSTWPVMTIVGPNTAIIQNLSNSGAYFSSYFLSLFNGLLQPGTTSTYAVSAIPLPPALMLMIASLAGLGGMAARKKKLEAA